MFFAADDRSVSGDGRSSRCCTVGELLQDCDSVSVMSVQEKCDEKKVQFGLRVRRTVTDQSYRVNLCNRDLSSTMGHARWEALYNFPVLILNQAASPLFILFAEAS
jgi:hypothetical protein